MSDQIPNSGAASASGPAPVPRACETYRAAWLQFIPAQDLSAREPVGSPFETLGEEHPDGLLEHARACAACRRWGVAALAVARLLAAAQPPGSEHAVRSAPAILAKRVAIELEEPGARIGRAYARLTPPSAPPALDRFVEDQLLRPRRPAPDLADWERASVTVKGLTSQRPKPAPDVLERLVDEELRAPAAYLADRYVGGLCPLSAPDLLAERLAAREHETLRPRLRAPLFPRLSGRILGPVLAAAAALLLIVSLRRQAQQVESDSASRWAFDVVLVDAPSDLGDGPAIGLLSALAGGIVAGETR